MQLHPAAAVAHSACAVACMHACMPQANKGKRTIDALLSPCRELAIIDVFERNTNSVVNVFDVTLQACPLCFERSYSLHESAACGACL